LLEARLAVQIRRRGSAFHVQGARSQAAEQLLRELYGRAKQWPITGEQVHLSLVGLEADAGSPGAGSSASSGVSEAHEARTARGPIRPRGPHQRAYMDSIREFDLCFGIGPAGTGKTYLAVACAVEALHSERVRRLVLVRPAVEAGERLGFLPGDLSQKVDPYLRPMYDALYEMLGYDRVARAIERNEIEVAPLAFMRGRSLNDSFIILDEAQNTTV